MTTFLYFAYGSNMLTMWLRQRCPAATPVGRAVAEGYRLNFSKVGLDGSGKANLGPASAQRVHGVLFTFSADDLPALDAAEARYDRVGHFPITEVTTGDTLTVMTYIAPPEACDAALLPFDWYHGLILAGAQEHELPDDYMASLQQVTTRIDESLNRPSRLAALQCLTFAAKHRAG